MRAAGDEKSGLAIAVSGDDVDAASLAPGMECDAGPIG